MGNEYYSLSSVGYDLMTLTYKFDLDILMVYVCITNVVSRSGISKVRAQTAQPHR